MKMFCLNLTLYLIIKKKSDIIVFDDYNEKNFPGVVKAVNYIAKEMSYNVEIIHNKETLRDYVIAKKN